MSCWVVPTIAAELWGVPLDDLMGRIDDGTVPSRTEHGFVLVDVAPDGDVFRRGRSGAEDRLDRLMHRDWVGRWEFRAVTEATLRGLGVMTPRE